MPLDPEIGKLYKFDIYEYYDKVCEYSEKYADAPKEHEFYYLEGEYRIEYEYNSFANSNSFLIYKTNNKLKWKAKILKIDNNNDFDINFPLDYPWAPPNFAFNTNLKPKFLHEINNKLKTLWHFEFMIKDVFKWIIQCLEENKLFDFIKISKFKEQSYNLTNLLYQKLIKDNKNKLLLEIDNKKDDIITPKESINQSNENENNETIDIESTIKLLNENDLYKIVNKEIGIINLGKTCYINSCLQILLHCPLFISKLINKKFLCNINNPFTIHFLYICCQIEKSKQRN